MRVLLAPLALRRLDQTLSRVRTGGGLAGDPTTLFARAVIDALDDPVADGDDPRQALFKRRSREAEIFVAGCLLRLLAADQKLFDAPHFGNRAQALFDRALTELYRSLGLSAKQQSFEKQAELREVVPGCEHAVAERSEKLVTTSASDMLAQREPVIKSLKRARGILGLALPPGLEDDVSALIHAAADALEAPSERRLAAEESYVEARSALTMCSDEYGTHHAKRFTNDITKALERAVALHRASNPLVPADMSVHPATKKYPLNESARAFRVRLVIENRAPCPAMGVEIEITASAGLEVESPSVYLGTIATGVAEIEFDAGSDPDDLVSDHAELLGILQWSNSDGTPGRLEFDCRLTSQTGGVDWTEVGGLSPYSLSPLSDPDQLVGRAAVLQALEAGISGEDSLSFLVSGQKRVGKTSLVQVLATRLRRAAIAVPVYLPVGTYADQPVGLARGVARRLGHALREQGGDAAARDLVSSWLTTHREPRFSDLYDLVDDVLACGLPAPKLLIILDEFDELPTELYQQSDDARAFFNTLRSLMILRDVSMILVGGERTNFVLAPHGQAVNLLKQQRLDAFARSDQTRDFADLVRHPAVGILDFTDQAVDALFEVTAGHPFYGRMVCGEVYRLMVERRDASVTVREVQDALGLVIDSATMTNFQHYWDDGILEVDAARRQEVRQQRVRYLVGVSRAMTKAGYARSDAVEADARSLGLETTIQHQIAASFEQRHVLTYDRSAGTLRPDPPIFARWLREHGRAELITAVPDQAAMARAHQQLADAHVRAGEITGLIRAWPPYRGRPIDADRVRAWLEQFGDEVSQRRAFNVLRGVRFVSDGVVRTAFREIHRSLMAGRARTPATKQKFRDVLVTSPDPPGKSGQVYARIYAQETSTHGSNVCDLRQLRDRVAKASSQIQCVVVVDDFVGSGDSLCSRLETLDPAAAALLEERGVVTSIVVYAATAEGLERVENALERHGLDWEIRAHRTLEESDRVFAPEAQTFDSVAEREATRALFKNVGTALVPNNPFGWGSGELGIVFESNIPNNALPPLWCAGSSWQPLFPRN